MVLGDARRRVIAVPEDSRPAVPEDSRLDVRGRSQTHVVGSFRGPRSLPDYLAADDVWVRCGREAAVTDFGTDPRCSSTALAPAFEAPLDAS